MTGKFVAEQQAKLKHNVPDKTVWKRRRINWIVTGKNCRLYDAGDVL
jgi:hypothetical protein